MLEFSHSQIVELSNKAWQDILDGDPASGAEILSTVLEANTSVGHLCNRGIAYILLARYQDAVSDFVQARNLRPAFRSMPFVGVALWLNNMEEEAVKDWLFEIDERRLRKPFYTDAAGGVEIPSLLWGAAVRLQRNDYKKVAESEMKRRLRTIQAQANWPGSIAAFLLGLITIEQLLEEANHKYPLVRSNQLCQANFHIASYYKSLGNTHATQYFLRECVVQPAIVQCEYHLAMGLLNTKA